MFYKKLFGRGFSFLVDDDYNAELTLNYPCSVIDIAIFYKFITMYCKYFNLDKFTQEGEEYNLDDIEKLIKEADDFNKRIICRELKVGLTIFGCIYPIVIDDDLILKLRSNEEDKAYNYFAKYLDNLQRPMYYYAIPLIYKNNNKYIAKYGLTKDVPSIFPKSTYLPFGYNQKILDNITSWSVAIIENQEYSITCEIPYNDFCKLININKLPKFDYKHKLVTIDNKIMAKISKYKIEKAKDELSNWLSDYRELGHKPSKIEYTNEFVTENIHCYIFKYKKERFSKWYLGIVSDSGTFSEFKEYKKENEIDDAKEIINLLKKFGRKLLKMWTNKKKYNKIILIQGGFMNKELLKHAQEYIEKMAQGINPITGEVVPEDDTLNNIKITRCLYYVNDVLKEVISKGIKGNKNKGIPFNLTIDELNNYEFTEELPLSKIVKKINDLKNNLDMNDLKLKDVYNCLLENDILKIEVINNRNCKRPTELGKSMGITVRRINNNLETYDMVFYSIEFQKFIIDNFNSLLEYINRVGK